MYRIHHPWFWIKSLMLDIFLGLRFYFVAAVAVASGQVGVSSVYFLAI